MTSRLTPQQIIESFRNALGEQFVEGNVYGRETGLEKHAFRSLWISIRREALTDAVRHIMTLEPYPHLAMITGSDRGDDIEVLYHFTIYFGGTLEELNLALRIGLPKNDLVVPTVTGFIPGALWTERELQEFFGVTVSSIPDDRRLLLEGVVPEGVHPWRKDDVELNKYLRVLPGRKPAAADRENDER